jgi:hypothetical protein
MPQETVEAHASGTVYLEDTQMMLRKKVIAIAAGAVLLGGTVGAFIAHRNSEPATAFNGTTTAPNPTDKQSASQASDNSGTANGVVAETEKIAGQDSNASNSETTVAKTVSPTTREAYRSSASRSESARRVYYDYNNQPAHRTFWQKHRDKMTVAMGAGGGALLGALFGGGKGAAIGALAGGGGSALYTYKLRNRHPSY